MSSALARYLSDTTAMIEPIYKNISELQWRVATTGQPEHETALGEAMQAYRVWMSNPARHAELSNLLADAAPDDPLLLREAKLLHNEQRANQIPPELIAQITDLELKIQSAFVNFRAVVRGEPTGDNELKKTLRTSDDTQLRRESWEASKQIGAQVADSVRALAQARNEAARVCGFDNYYVMRLELDELNETELFGLLDALKSGTDPAWRAYKSALDQTLSARFGVPVESLRPWHYADPFFQEGQPGEVNLDPYFADKNLEALTERYFSAVGLEVADVLARSDLYERPGKEQHAFCTHIDRSGDVRVLCNNRPDKYWMETMLHEFGHAVYDKYLDMKLPFALRAPAHTLTTEAVAILSGNLINESAWLSTYAGIAPETAQTLSAGLRESLRTSALIFARWVFVMCNFERALYRDPAQDLNTLWWDCVERYQSVNRPEGRDAPDWAAKIHIGTAPVYYHNYLLGAMMAAQLRDHLVYQVAGDEQAYVSSPKVGSWMIETLFRPGATRDWRGWLLHATGQQLGADAYATRLSV
jgi:peptidyl-dipeptidase A